LFLLEGGLQLAGVLIRGLDDRHKETTGLSQNRILALGACYTVGVGSQPHESYPRQLEELLDEGRPELDLSVINGGIRGKSIAYFATYIDAMLDDADPQVVIINVNDRLTYTPQEVAEAKGILDSPWRQAKRRFEGAMSHSVLYRVGKLAMTPPPEETGLPKDWWSAGPGGADGDDQLSHAIQQAEEDVRAYPRDPELWSELARLAEKRLDYDRARQAHLAAIGLVGGRPASHHHHQLLRISAGQRHFAEAARQLDLARTESEGYQNLLYDELKSKKRRVALDDPLEAMLYKLLLADYYALFGDLGDAIRLLQEVITAMPSIVQARDMLAFYLALNTSLALGKPLPEQATVETDALFAKDRVSANGGKPSGAALFGVYEATAKDQTEISLAEAERRFGVVLEYNLAKILRAAESRGIPVLVENLSSLPAQAPVIKALTDAYGVPLVDLQGALAAHPNRTDLLHPTMNLRLSAAGNRFVATQIYAALDTEGLLQ
jgi:tetratricopeptide (TPR) repeat protein